jgi:hypothetical protein
VYTDSGDVQLARELGHETVARCRTLGNRTGLARSLNAEARSAAVLGDTGVALVLARESVEAMRESGERYLEIEMLLGVGFVHLLRSDFDDAQRYSESAFELALAMTWSLSVAQAQNQRAHIARLQADHVSSVRWHAEAAAIREALQTPIHRTYQRSYEMDLVVARDVLGSDAFDTAWEEGRSRATFEAEDPVPVTLSHVDLSRPVKGRLGESA